MVETEWKNATIPIGWGYDGVACEQTRSTYQLHRGGEALYGEVL